MPEHSIPHIAACIFALLSHVAAYAIYMMFARKSGVEWGVMNKTEPDIFEYYNTEFAPDRWGSVFWQVIYPFYFWWLLSFLWQLKKPKRDCCDYSYKMNPWLIHFFFGLGGVFQVARVLLFGFNHFLASFFMALLSGLFLIAAVVMLTPKSRVSGQDCPSQYTLINNSILSNLIAVYAVWAIYYALANLSLVLVHASPIRATSQDAAIGCLSFVLILVVINIGLDLTILDGHNRYQIASYFAKSLAIGCVLSNHNKKGSRNTALTIAVLVIILIALLAKIINCFVREYLIHRDRNQRVNSASKMSEEKTSSAYCA